MKHANLIYQSCNGTFNLGDYIQSLAAAQYFPKIDLYLNREELAKYNGSPAKIIMNGWFTHKPKTWIPSPKLHPLFISFHINESAKKDMLSDDGIAYLKKHQPIGCRDHATVNILRKVGVEAYFSGCLTLTLDCYKKASTTPRKGIYIVDPLFNYPTYPDDLQNWKGLKKFIRYGTIFKFKTKQKVLHNILSDELIEKAQYLTHDVIDTGQTEQEKFTLAENMLNKYSTAELVVTSRIHVALPCLALNTPVIFINKFNTLGDTCRFDGITDLFNTIDVLPDNTCHSPLLSKGKLRSIKHLQNPSNYLNYVHTLKKTCEDFI